MIFLVIKCYNVMNILRIQAKPNSNSKATSKVRIALLFRRTILTISSVQEGLISQLCVVVSQGLCSEKIEAKLMLRYIAFKYAFLNMVSVALLFSEYLQLTKSFKVLLLTSFLCSSELDLLLHKWSRLGWSIQTTVPSSQGSSEQAY